MSRKSLKKRKTQSQYPASLGLNLADQPASNQLNNKQEQPLAPSVASQMFTPVNQQMVSHGDAHQATISNHPYTDPPAVYSNPHWPTPYNPLPMSMGGDPSTFTGAMNPTDPIPQLPMTGYYQGPYVAGPLFQDYQLPSYDPPTLRMDQGAPYPHQPPIDSKAHVAPYAQGQANVSARLHVGELVHGVQFSEGIIKVVSRTLCDVRRPRANLRLLLLQDGPAARPSHVTQVPAPPPTAPSRELQLIYHDVCELVKGFVLQTNVMSDGKKDLTPLLTKAIQQVIQDDALADIWVKKYVEESIKKLDNAASYVRSLFKDCAASRIQDAYDLQASAAIFHGLSEIDWKRSRIHALHLDLLFLSANTSPLDLNTRNIFISPRIADLIINVVFLGGLSKYLANCNMITSVALAGTVYYWALEQHSHGILTPINFTIDKYKPLYTKIMNPLVSISHTIPFIAFVDEIFHWGALLLGRSL
ncbi:hypothetical protein BDN67DRAFT_1014281 [Paxillus ammoniavirescens]|nr:hypothetical protein BDN67DRAFT_1014281 [Paxillus ammoniavirescens]